MPHGALAAVAGGLARHRTGGGWVGLRNRSSPYTGMALTQRFFSAGARRGANLTPF